MARIFITGSADGLGKMAAQRLVAAGHFVVLHARNQRRAQDALAGVPAAATAIAGDLASLAETHDVAKQLNGLGAFDAIVHNAGVGYRESQRDATVDGLPRVFAVNTLATYVLTALVARPKRLIYLSSGLHQSGDATLTDLTWEHRSWNGFQAYADTKLHDALLAFAIARRWPDVLSNAVEPGWVATKMGGAGATDDLQAGCETQAWLAVADETGAQRTGEYFYHRKLRKPNAATRDTAAQDRLLDACRSLSGVDFPS